MKMMPFFLFPTCTFFFFSLSFFPLASASSTSSHSPSLPVWTCFLQKETRAWTVGGKREMTCQGDYSEKFETLPQIVFITTEFQEINQDSQESKSFLPPQAKGKEQDLRHSLVILKLNMSDHDRASFIVTGYKTGNFSSPFFLKTPQVRILVNPLTWKIESILQTQEQMQGFGPIGPFLLSWPKKYKWALWGMIALFFCFLLFKLYQRALKRKWRKKMLQKRTSLSPYFQLNKDLRRKTRDYYYGKKDQVEEKDKETWNKKYISEIKEDFLLFLGREFLIPTHVWKINVLIKEIKKCKIEENKKQKKLYDLADQLLFLMKEFEKAQDDKNPLKDLDCDQMVEWIKKWAGKWEDMKKSHPSLLNKMQ